MLVKVIMTNDWNGQEMTSTADFKLSIGQECSLKFDTTDAQKPFVGQD